MSVPQIPLVEDQVLFFRAKRGHLASPGADDPAGAARAVLGAQAQQETPGLLGLSIRTAGRPMLADVKSSMIDAPRQLVRTWGQRDTLHIYDPDDWHLIVAIRPDCMPGGRRGAMPPESAVEHARSIIDAAGGVVTRRDIVPAIPDDYLAEAEAKIGSAKTAMQFAAGRILWCLAHRGEVSIASQIGTERTYAARTAWYPKTRWPKIDSAKAGAKLARRYLSVHGAASPRDVAHFHGASVTTARRWLGAIEDDLVDVECGDRKKLCALAKDVPDLTARPPAVGPEWPVRFLPMWDTMLMGHADKRWTVPDEAERPLVWKKAAMVAPVVLAGGRIVATWSYAKKSKHLEVHVTPLGGWDDRYADEAEAEAAEIAAIMGLDEVETTIG